MKNHETAAKVRRRLSAGITAIAVLIGSAGVSALAANPFTDVNQGDWFYDNVTAMTEQGLFSGYEDGSFRPGNNMSRAEFLTVVCRILDLDISKSGDDWYAGAYNSAVDAGLIKETEMRYNLMLSFISRQEMAMVAVRAMEKRGESVKSAYTENVKNSIPDRDKISSYYMDYVLKSYENGILCGEDEEGAFNPTGKLSRAAATTVLYRIIEPSARENRDFSKATPVPVRKNFDGTSDSDEPITIIEGTVEKRRFAREGDTVIKADGTQVVLKKVDGILGKGQGVAPDLGVQVDGIGNTTVINCKVFSGKTTFKDSTGRSVVNGTYRVNNVTGEGHWDTEWLAITSKPTVQGTFNFQLSEDKNWVWLADFGEWAEVSVQEYNANGVSLIRQANGLE